MSKTKRGGRGRKPVEVAAGFGEAIHELMLLKRTGRTPWKGADLAKQLRVSEDAVRAWFGGRLPRAEQLLPLARLLGTTTDDLLLAHETGDISHISAIPEQIRTSAEERASAVVEAPQVSLKKKRGPG